MSVYLILFRVQGREGFVSLSRLAELADPSKHDLLSTDLFDTVLLRDSTIETHRLAAASFQAASVLGIDPWGLTRLRWDVQDNAYRAVDVERPEGDVTLRAICRTVVSALGLGADAARVLHDIEVTVDMKHLSPNRPLLELLTRASGLGLRVVAVSDTYYSAGDLCRMLDVVIGEHPITMVYSSADLGSTKHAGMIFEEVMRRERVPPSRIVHVGDNRQSDVVMAQAANWTAVHLPRTGGHRAKKFAGKVLALPTKMRRSW